MEDHSNDLAHAFACADVLRSLGVVNINLTVPMYPSVSCQDLHCFAWGLWRDDPPLDDKWKFEADDRPPGNCLVKITRPTHGQWGHPLTACLEVLEGSRRGDVITLEAAFPWASD